MSTEWNGQIYSRKDLLCSRHILAKIHDKRKAWKYYKKYPTALNLKDYHFHRNLVTNEARNAKRNKETKIAKETKQNPKALFKYVNSKTKPKEGIANLTKEDGTQTTSDQEKSTVLNNFFSSVFVTEDDSPIPTLEAEYEKELNYVNINEEDMKNALQNLNISKSPGPDKMYPRILKELAKELANPLHRLFKKTMDDGKLPDTWKEAEVIPIFKKGLKTSPGNYRPVSLTSIICKLFEHFIRDALYNHFVENDLLSPDQYGFCKGRSCVSQLLVTINEWFSYLDNKIPVDAAYLDFRKAFDTVPHKRLLSKLHGYGVRENTLRWVEDFLNQRTQYVRVNSDKSETVPVTSGVPQGSVLGPTLFIYFINDLPDEAESFIKIFADDTKAYTSINTEEDQKRLQRTINNMVEWTEKWLLKFNSEKCKILHLGKNNPKYKYTIKGNGIETDLAETLCEKDLGIMVDPLLNFNEHRDTTVKKARRTSSMLLRHISHKEKDIMVPLYKALVRPIIEYGNSVWCPYKDKDIKPIEKVQRNFTKHINGNRNLSYEERMKKLKIPSQAYRRLRGDLIESYKILHKKYDPKTTNSLLTISANTKNTRSNTIKLTKPSFNAQPYQMFFTNRVINHWNSLPEEIVTARSLNVFKNKIDKHFCHLKYSTKVP